MKEQIKILSNEIYKVVEIHEENKIRKINCILYIHDISENSGYSSSIPKPIIEMLGNPESIKFVVKDNNEVALVSGKISIDNKIRHIKS